MDHAPILILDANQRSALAATRLLGKKGIPVIVADEKKETLSSVSKYCKESFAYPSPYKFPNNFIETLKKEVTKRKIHIIFPMTDITTYLLLKYNHKFNAIIPFGSFDAFDTLSNKWTLFKLAQRLNLPMPKTYFIDNPEKIKKIAKELSYPIVIKPYRSRILKNGKWITASVYYANSPNELIKLATDNLIFKEHPFLLQHYIKGTGQGIFALYDQGKPICFFAHKRLREKPPSGGVSVLRESIPVNPKMKEIAQKLLNHVNWHGVAMVEFRVSEEDTPYLMEVNARFWGSLQLAIDAGVDFPYLLYQIALGKKVSSNNSYKIGIKTRWLLGDLDYLYMRLFKNKSNLPPNYPSKLKCILEFLKFYDRNTKYEIESLYDPKPFLCELKQYIREIFRSKTSSPLNKLSNSINPNNALKGMSHVHSNFSYDGHNSIPQIVEFLKAKGYSFVCLTEHSDDFNQEKMDKFIRCCEENTSEEFLVIPGIEYRCKNIIHLIGLGINRFYHLDNPFQLIEKIHSEGGLAIIAHPHGYQDNISPDLIKSVSGIEIWNGQKDSRFIPRYNLLSSFKHYQKINPKLIALAGADLHTLANYFPLDMIIMDCQLDKTSILNAFKEGRFYIKGRYWKIKSPNVSFSNLFFLFFARQCLNLLRDARNSLLHLWSFFSRFLTLS